MLRLSAVGALLWHGICRLTVASPISGDWISVPVTDGTCNVLDYGAKGDGVTLDTAAIQAAITACMTSHGTAVVPAGRVFLSQALTVRNANVFALRIDGTLRFHNDTKSWPRSAEAAITVTGSSFFALHGFGMLDGLGATWWPDQFGFRPNMVHTQGGTDLLVRDVTFFQSPSQNLQSNTEKMEVRQSGRDRCWDKR